MPTTIAISVCTTTTTRCTAPQACIMHRSPLPNRRFTGRLRRLHHYTWGCYVHLHRSYGLLRRTFYLFHLCHFFYDVHAAATYHEPGTGLAADLLLPRRRLPAYGFCHHSVHAIRRLPVHPPLLGTCHTLRLVPHPSPAGRERAAEPLNRHLYSRGLPVTATHHYAVAHLHAPAPATLPPATAWIAVPRADDITLRLMPQTSAWTLCRWFSGHFLLPLLPVRLPWWLGSPAPDCYHWWIPAFLWFCYWAYFTGVRSNYDWAHI